jgi:hypothetical protein
MILTFPQYCERYFESDDFYKAQTARDVCADTKRPKTLNKRRWATYLRKMRADPWAYANINDLLDEYAEYLNWVNGVKIEFD